MSSIRQHSEEIEGLFSHYLGEVNSEDPENTTVGNSKPPPHDIAPPDEDAVCQLVKDILCPSKKDQALVTLCRYRFSLPKLPYLIWNSFGVVTTFVFDISTTFPCIVTGELESLQCKRVCHELALIHQMATNDDARPFLLKANFPIFLYPLVRSTCNSINFEYIRLSCLTILSALVSFSEPDTAAYVLSTELIPVAGVFLESRNHLCAIVAAKTIRNLLSDKTGFRYICNSYDRFARIIMSLGKVSNAMVKNPNHLLLKNIIQCYRLLIDHPMAAYSLTENTPACLLDGTFDGVLSNDLDSKIILENLCNIITSTSPAIRSFTNIGNSGESSALTSGTAPAVNTVNDSVSVNH